MNITDERPVETQREPVKGWFLAQDWLTNKKVQVTEQAQKQQVKERGFQEILKSRFPTMIGAVSLGSDTSKAMKEANRQRAIQAAISKSARSKRV